MKTLHLTLSLALVLLLFACQPAQKKNKGEKDEAAQNETPPMEQKVEQFAKVQLKADM